MTSRVVYIDFLRVLGCIAVVSLHAAGLNGKINLFSPEWFTQNSIDSLSIWAVPLFIMMSGALLLSGDKQESITYFYQKRLFRIGLPMLVWIPFYFIFYHFYRGDPLTIPAFLYRITFSSFDHLYFLPLIFELYLLTPFLRKMLVKIHYDHVTLLFLITLFTFIGFFWTRAGFTPYLFVPFISYFLMGAYLKHYTYAFLSQGWLIAVFSAAILSLAYFFTFIIPRSHIVDTFVYYTPGPIIFLYTVSVFTCIQKTITNIPFWIQEIADNSLGIYILHPFILSLSWLAIQKILHLATYPWYLMILFIPYGVISSYMLVRIIKKIPLIGNIL